MLRALPLKTGERKTLAYSYIYFKYVFIMNYSSIYCCSMTWTIIPNAYTIVKKIFEI